MSEVDPQQRAVREVLAGQADPVMPDDVARRLEGVLRAEQERRSSPSAGVVTIGDRRSRVHRWAPLLAVAALVVGVLAVAVPLGLHGSSSSSESSSRSSAADSGGSSARATEPEAPAAGRLQEGAAISLSPGSFGRDLRTQVIQPGLRADLVAAPSLAAVRCSGDVPSGAGLDVTVGGRPARLYASGPIPATTFTAIGCAAGRPRVLATATVDATS